MHSAEKAESELSLFSFYHFRNSGFIEMKYLLAHSRHLFQAAEWTKVHLSCPWTLQQETANQRFFPQTWSNLLTTIWSKITARLWSKIMAVLHAGMSLFIYLFKKQATKEFPPWISSEQTRLASMRMQVLSLPSLSGLGIRRCCELWWRLPMWLRSCVAVAVA